MQKLFFGLLIGFTLSASAQQDAANSQAQTTNGDVPNVTVFTIDDLPFETKNIQNDGKPIVIDFWATWCKPCIRELNAIQGHYAEWQKETGVKIYAVSIDDERTKSEVKPRVSTWEWEYEVLKDPNSDLKRAMNVTNVPHVFLLDGNRKIVSQHTTYAPGDEKHLYEEIQKLLGHKVEDNKDIKVEDKKEVKVEDKKDK